MSAAPPTSAGQVIYAIGDVHGCYDLMVDLLDRIVADIDRSDAQGRAMLLFLGDYVDRGPAASDVLTALLWLERHSPVPAVFLKGNHEQVLLDYLDSPGRNGAWLRVGGGATLRSYGVDVGDDPDPAVDHLELRDRLTDRMPASHLDFLRRLRLSYESDHFIFAHAGIRMGVPLRAQQAEDLLWIREGFLEERAPGAKRVVHGHTWVGKEPQLLRHRIGVDTGAYETGVLTAAKLTGESVAFIAATD